MPKIAHWIVVLLLIFGLSACSLPMSPKPTSLATSTQPVPSEVPLTPTFISIPSTAPTQVPTTIEPTLTPRATAVLPTETTIPTLPPSKILFDVFLVDASDKLKVYSGAGSTYSVIDTLAADAIGIEATGKQVEAENATWVEVKTSAGKQGWVNRYYLTEDVPPAIFCQDTRVDALIGQFRQSLDQKDPNGFAATVSPVHGLFLQYLRGGTVANYDRAKLEYLFKSQYVMNWGIHPGSGLPVRGTFMQEPYPALVEVFDSPDTQKTCEKISAGGTTYTATWPKEYEHINLLSFYKPGPSGHELNWRTWLTGIEYIDGKPYILALYQLIWEP